MQDVLDAAVVVDVEADCIIVVLFGEGTVVPVGAGAGPLLFCPDWEENCPFLQDSP
jgi:hypothetical protein